MHRVKYQSELCRTLAHVLVDHAIKQDCEERHGELAGNCCRGHSLSCPRGAGEEETLTRGEAMRFECGCFQLFTNFAFAFPPKPSIENPICKPRFRIFDLEQSEEHCVRK